MTLHGAIALIAFAHVHGRWRAVALVVPTVLGVLVALGRLYRGVHYPTDVLASAFLALTWVALTYWLLLHRPWPAARMAAEPAGRMTASDLLHQDDEGTHHGHGEGRGPQASSVEVRVEQA